MSVIDELKVELKNYAEPDRIEDYARFFKTGKGEYGEGDIFIGVKVPDQRKISKQFYKSFSLNDVQELLKSKVHEERLTALHILRLKYEKTKSLDEKKECMLLYTKSFKHINNWDLVDSSAHYILGDYLYNYDNKDATSLIKYAKSNDLWTRRIGIMSTFYFIKQNEFKDALTISEILLTDEHDLIHKSVGWMLREIGNRDFDVEEEFLKKHYKDMPRTMLRYAIEKFPKHKKEYFMKK